MNTYEQLDLEGRNKFKQLCIQQNWKYQEPHKDRLAYDCSIIDNNGNFILVELKNRSPKYSHYNNLFLEQDKYNRLKSWKTKLNANSIWYVNFFDNIAYIFNLDDDYITANPSTQYMNRITVESTTFKVPKQVYLLPKNRATKFEIL